MSDDTDLEHMFLWAHEWKANEEDSFSFGPSEQKLEACKKYNFKIIICTRDPRDLICALVRGCYGTTSKEHLYEAIKYPGKTIARATGLDQPFLKKYTTYSECISDYLEWKNYPNVYLTSFEKLVGPNGGGDRKVQIQEVLNIAAFIGREIDYEKAGAIADQLFGGTPTFIKGQIKDWEKTLSQDLLKLYYRKEGNLAQKLGYE